MSSDGSDGDGGSATDTYRWVSAGDRVHPLAAEIGDGPLALDTEADSFHHYQEKICLIQLSFSGQDVLLDPLAGADPTPLGPVLADRRVRKILHGADYDLRLLHRDFGLTVSGLFDTMIAARLIGERSFGLAALLEHFLDVRLDKRFQRADWSARPLSAEMARYAVLDTRHLETLTAKLEARLEALGRREWAAQEFQRVEQVRWTATREPDDAWRRLKGVSRMNRRQLAVAQGLARLREDTARARDVPAFRVVRDEVLLELVSRPPADRETLARVRGLGRPWKEGKGADAVLEAIERAFALAESDLPEPPGDPRRERPPKELEARLRQLCRQRDRIAAELELEPSLLASRATLERTLGRVAAGADPATTDELRPWQLDLLVDALRSV